MGLWKRTAPGDEASDAATTRRPPPQEHTLGVTQSQILSISQPPPVPPRPARRREPSLWGNKVLGADDFAPDKGRARRGARGWAFFVVVAALAGAGAWMWRSWPNLPLIGNLAPASAPTVKSPVPTQSARVATPPAPTPTVAAAAPAPSTAAPAAPAIAPAPSDTATTAAPAKVASQHHRHHHHKSAKSRKHAHAKSTAPADE